ncbi:GrpB family protein [Microbacterium sp. NPDC055903]
MSPPQQLAAAFAGAELGLLRGRVVLASPTRRWHHVFDRVRDLLMESAPAAVRSIEHIGSTAVPGLAAKPILDVAVALTVPVDAGAVLPDVDAWLTRLGLSFRGEANGIRPDRLYGYELDPRVRLMNVHVLEHGTDAWHHYIDFRDRLRTSAADRDAYAALKARLARRHPNDRIAYVEAKGDFIRERR